MTNHVPLHSITTGYAEATEDTEATPDSGIEIYVNENKENRIYIFQQHGHISEPNPLDHEVESNYNIRWT